VEPRKAFAGIFVRRPCWTLSWRGKIALLAIAVVAFLAGIDGLYPFLAITKRVPSDVLVIDGWMPTQVLGLAAAEFKRNNYRRAFVVRGVYDLDSKDLEQTWDDYVANILVRRGIPRDRLTPVLFPGYKKDRTYHSALAIKDWCIKNGVALKSFDVATVGSHARRSRLLFEKAFGKDTNIGVIALDDPAFDSGHWWRSSEGVHEVPFEAAAYLYVLLIFSPNP
jgi:hypothetical protein